MRVVVANCHRGTVGGTERYLRALIPELLARGHEVAVLHQSALRSGQAAIDPGEANLTVWCVDRLGRDAARRAVSEWAPDLVYFNSSGPEELDEALIARVPAVLFAHDYGGTCATGSKCHSFPARRPCSRTFGPMCLVLHYPRRCGGLNPVTLLTGYRAQLRRRSLLPRYQAVLVASRHMEHEFSRHGVRPDRLHFVPLPPTGVAPDPDPPAPRACSGTLLMAGRLTKLKGTDYLVQAVSRASSALGVPLRLSIAGEGPDRAAVDELARQHHVAVQFHGWVDGDRLAALMREADLLAVPSVWPEPFGLVGIEAGGVGLPSVAYEVGGIGEWLVPGTSGELAPGDPPTVEGLAEAIVRALRDPVHYASLRRGAWDAARRRTMAAHIALLEPVFRHAVDGWARGSAVL